MHFSTMFTSLLLTASTCCFVWAGSVYWFYQSISSESSSLLQSWETGWTDVLETSMTLESCVWLCLVRFRETLWFCWCCTARLEILEHLVNSLSINICSTCYWVYLPTCLNVFLSIAVFRNEFSQEIRLYSYLKMPYKCIVYIHMYMCISHLT